MDLSHFLRRSSRGSSDPEKKVNPRSVLYKRRGNRKVKLRDTLKTEWKEKRNRNLDELRGIEEEGEGNESIRNPSALSKKRLKDAKDEQDEILNRLAEYRLRKQQKKATEAKDKKPAFKVGLVHHKPYPFNQEIPKSFGFKNKKGSQKDLSVSPYIQERSCQDMESETHDITMETPPQKENIINHVPIERPPINKTPFKPPLPTLTEECDEEGDVFKAPHLSTPSSRRRRASLVSPLLDGLRTDICFKRGTSSDIRRAKKGLPSKLTSPFDDIIREIDHAKLSGKSLEDELGVVSLKEDLIVKKDVSIFRKLYNDNVDKLISLSDALEKADSPPSEELKGRISATVGKARLIISKKGRLQQFSNLVDNCEFGRGEKETNTEDLRGFWDMISFQIEEIYNEFEEISVLKLNNWKSKEEELVEPPIKQLSPKPLKKAVLNKNKKAKASSGLMAMLKAKRSQMRNESRRSSGSNNATSELKIEDCKNFDGGFFQVSSPVRETNSTNASPTPKTTPLMNSKTPHSKSSYLRKSILMNSVMKVSSSARRSLCLLDESIPPKICAASLENDKEPSTQLTTPKRRSSRRLSSLANISVDGIDKVSSKSESARSSQVNDGNEDLISFESPMKSFTPRRSKRLSSRLMTPVNYK